MENRESSENEKDGPESGTETNGTTPDNATDEPPGDNGKPAIRLFSAEFLLKNPAGVSFVLSSIFLVTGASYNLGLFFFIDPKLVSVLPLTDHISTSISISLTLVALGVLLTIVSSFCLSVLWGLLAVFEKVCGKIEKFREKKDTSPTTEKEKRDRPKSGAGKLSTGQKDATQTVFGCGKFLEDHALIIYPVVFNVLLFSLIYFISVEELLDRFDTLGIVLIIIGSIALALYVQHMETDRDKRDYFRFGSFVILLYLIPFQLGVLESTSGYSFIYEKEHTRPYSINNKEVHLLRADSNGVFYSVKSLDKETPGSIHFEPWSKVERLSYRLRSPSGS